MGPHPIPQNVTTFQFKLVGDMTLKQFIYLATGAGIAYVFFVFFVPPYPFFAWPLVITSATIGAAFAFLPIGSRPLDHWLGAFLKAIYSPTQRVWKKDKQLYTENPFFPNRYQLLTMPVQIAISAPVAKPAFTPAVMPKASASLSAVNTVNNTPQEALAVKFGPTAETKELPSSDQLKKTVELAKEAQALQVKIIQTERTLNQIRTAAKTSTPIPVNYTEEINKVFTDLQKLVSQASEIRSEMDDVSPVKNSPKLEPKPLKESVKVVVPVKPKQTQIALTAFPNVISGIIKNNQGDYLEAVVAVIYDKEGLPVRALKTNKLGQFSGSTPLPNGTYNLELEKEGYSFDVLQIQLEGQVLPPLMITTKGAAA